MTDQKRKSICRALICGAAALALTAGPAWAQSRAQLDLKPQPLAQSLKDVARQTGTNILFTPESLAGLNAPAVSGNLTAPEAVNQLIAGTNLEFAPDGAGGYVVRQRSAEGNAPGAGGPGLESASTAQGSEQQSDGAIAEILVQGRRTQNVDIRRTEDDPQPYVVFDRKEIERSQATNLEEFIRRKLPMNTTSLTGSQSAANASRGNTTINLRGFGVDQTLILIDGRRAPRLARDILDNGLVNAFTQADVSGIPLAAIERIEVLPSTAGGIYGGGAVGGVINIIRRRDYSGLDLRTSYTATSRGGGETFRVDLSGGFSLEGGKTQISFSASHAASEPLYTGDRSFWRRDREREITNDPTNFFSFPEPGYTTNIRSLSGDLVLDDGRSLGSPITHVPVGYAGPITDGGTALLATAGNYSLALGDHADGGGKRSVLLNGPRVRSANLNLRRSFSNEIDGFVDLTMTDNLGRSYYGESSLIRLDADAPGNPFQQHIYVNVPLPRLERPMRNRSEVLAGSGGMIARLGGGWTASAEYGWSRSRTKEVSSRPAVAESNLASAAASGAIDVLRDVNRFSLDLSPYVLPSPNLIGGPYDNVQQTASARLSGNLFRLPGGMLSLTALIERREEEAKTAYLRSIYGTNINPARTQSVNSGYIELRAPVISTENAVPFIRELELQASVRHDRYKTRVASPTDVFAPAGTTLVEPDWEYSSVRMNSTDYTFGARWALAPDISLRASYATGFLPPSIGQLVPYTDPNYTLAIGTDPLRGSRYIGGEIPFHYTLLGNPRLRPEQSKSLALGLIFTPRFLPGLRLSVDYTRVKKSDEIISPSPETIAAHPGLFAGRIERGPNLPGDPEGWPGPITRLDATLVNIASSRVQAFDFQADYDFQTERFGNFRFFGVATLQTEYHRTIVPTVLSYDAVGFYDGPLRWTGNTGLHWSIGAWEIMWNSQYFHSYSAQYANPDLANLSDDIVRRQGAERIPSQIYHDLAVQYRFDAGNSGQKSLLSGLEVRLGIQNVFDSYPPVVVTSHAGYSTYGDPRLRRFTLSIRKRFGG